MLTLITGAPGAGKSAMMVSLLMAEKAGRAIYVDGVPELAIPHLELGDGLEWHKTVPDGSLVVIDEVQRVWRAAGPGQRVPEAIAALETHRHRGVDFILITQQPRLVHANVRALIGRHIHLRDLGVLGRWLYEWPECSEGLSWKTAPVKQKWALPKQTFAQYKSASVHIKPSRRIPTAVIVFVLAVVFAGGLGWYAFVRVRQRMAPAVVAAPQGAGVPGAGGKVVPVQSGPEMVAALIPRVANVPGSAPAYDALRKVVAMPRVVAGYCEGNRCTCLTQQGTDAGLTGSDCSDWVHHRPFDPFVADKLPNDPRERGEGRPQGAPSEGTPSSF